jgi:phosphoglycolate phosphatase-like HAD superfamily hydrolase
VHVLALDFDGVISDSGPEAFVVALRTYAALRPVSALTLEAPSELRREAISETELYRRFVEGMPLGNRAEDFGVVLAAIEAGHALPDQAAYDTFKTDAEARSPRFLEDFHARFYRERDAFAAVDSAAWHALLGPYPEFVELLARRRGDVQLAIATAKDRPAVDRLLAAYEIEHLFPPELVLDKETGVSKRAHLEALHRRTGSAFDAITFVDDKVNHLEDVATLGVRCALAGWGYNGAREKKRALERGYLVCELDDAEAQLFGP